MGTLAIGGLGVPEIMIALAVILLLFGGKKLPELARAMGSSITQFKKGLNQPEEDEPERLTGGEKPKSE